MHYSSNSSKEETRVLGVRTLCTLSLPSAAASHTGGFDRLGVLAENNTGTRPRLETCGSELHTWVPLSSSA